LKIHAVLPSLKKVKVMSDQRSESERKYYNTWTYTIAQSMDNPCKKTAQQFVAYRFGKGEKIFEMF